MRIADELRSSFPGLRVLELRLTNLLIKHADPRLDEFRIQVQQGTRSRIGSLDKVKDQAIFRAYRDFFWGVGVDPTKTRPAGEALTRRILSGRDLPRINTLVDAYNLASVETSIAIAAFDMASIREETLYMRKAAVGERFRGIAMDSEMSLSGREVVIEDESSSKLVAIYPYRDSDDSKVTEQTKDVLLMMCGVPGVDDLTLQKARSLCGEYVERFCGSRMVEGNTD